MADFNGRIRNAIAPVVAGMLSMSAPAASAPLLNTTSNFDLASFTPSHVASVKAQSPTVGRGTLSAENAVAGNSQKQEPFALGVADLTATKQGVTKDFGGGTSFGVKPLTGGGGGGKISFKTPLPGL